MNRAADPEKTSPMPSRRLVGVRVDQSEQARVWEGREKQRHGWWRGQGPGEEWWAELGRSSTSSLGAG